MYRKKGFTLIELLVVIAIITLLLGILMPSLRKARAQAKRIICMHNNKTIITAVVLYGQDFDDCLPLGYQWGAKQYNYPIWDQDYVIWGGIYEAGYMKNHDSWVCPAYRGWDIIIDAWPPEDVASGKIVGGLHQTAVSTYGSRPDWHWEPVAPGVWNPDPFGKLQALSSRTAIISDWVSDPFVFSLGHEGGLNTGYADGHSTWVPVSEFEDILDGMRGPWGRWYNDDMEELWNVFDSR